MTAPDRGVVTPQALASRGPSTHDTGGHASAKDLGLGCELSSLALAVSVLQKLALLAVKRQQSGFGIAATPLVLANGTTPAM